MVFRIWYPMWFSVFPICVSVPLGAAFLGDFVYGLPVSYRPQYPPPKCNVNLLVNQYF